MVTIWWYEKKRSRSINDHIINKGKEIVIAREFVMLKNSIQFKYESEDINFHKKTSTMVTKSISMAT